MLHLEVTVTIDLTDSPPKTSQNISIPNFSEEEYVEFMRKNATITIKILPYKKEKTSSETQTPELHTTEISFQMKQLLKIWGKKGKLSITEFQNYLRDVAESFAEYSFWVKERQIREVHSTL